MKAKSLTQVMTAISLGFSLIPTVTLAEDAFQFGTPTQGEAYAPAFSASFETADALLETLETSINSSFFKASKLEAINEKMGQAASSPGMALIADRLTDFSLFTVGVGAGLNAVADGFDFALGNNEIPSFGLVATGAVNVGIKASLLGIKQLGPIVGERLSFYLSFATASANVSVIDANFFNLGVNVQYGIIPPIGVGVLAKWTGINVLSGFNYATSRVTINSSISQTSTSEDNDVSTTLTLPYSVGLQSNTVTIPIEVNTGATLLYLINVYTGGALDFNFGSASLVGEADGSVEMASVTAGGTILEADATLDFERAADAGTPSAVNARTFFGAHLPLGPVKLGGEYTIHSSGANGFYAWVRIAL